MGNFLESIINLPGRAKDMQSCLMLLLRFEEISLNCGSMGMVFIVFALEISLHFVRCDGIMGPKFEPKRRVPSKIRLS